ncbi:DUF962 domain-containing protein [Fulvivirga sedimenti]|uniref:DUF962 domain-containing protein n=1 Tax=Fulvivirga sedimenti TaxID=2879465 RepID=A0A9X1HPN3_9BACT|nr:Mpo1-like protein [Fulvivirga sedimenti]MCA6074024.1 DUF962 domain-containing protein [Fulvivirga sedimenti]
MSKIDQLLAEYGESHQNETNKLIHWICVPLIFFSVVGFFWAIPSWGLKDVFGSANPYLNWATLALALVMIYYLSLSFALSFGMLLFGSLCLFGWSRIDMATEFPIWGVALIIFVLAWIGQFYGHKIEGKKPSFFKDLQFLLIGPAWLMHFIYRKAGISY